MARLNWRLVLIHLLAAWFLVNALPMLSALYDPARYEAWQKFYSGEEEWEAIVKDNDFTPGQMLTYAYYIKASWIIGLLIAFIISLTISIKHKWFWANSVIVLLVIFTLQKLNALGWTYARTVFTAPGNLFNTTALYLLANGLIMTVIALFLFYSRLTMRFIQREQPPARQ